MVDLAKDSLNLSKAFSHLEKRIGFKMDIGAGLSGDAQDNKIDSLDLYRLGIWSNLGWTSALFDHKTYVSVIFLARFFNYTDLVYSTEEDGSTIFENLGVLDLGAQFKLDVSAKFSLSLEVVYRAGFDERFANTYKINALAQYKFGINRLIFVSFGNALNETTDTGPEQLMVNIGLNLGFGDNVTIKRVNIP